MSVVWPSPLSLILSKARLFSGSVHLFVVVVVVVTVPSQQLLQTRNPQLAANTYLRYRTLYGRLGSPHYYSDLFSGSVHLFVVVVVVVAVPSQQLLQTCNLQLAANTYLRYGTLYGRLGSAHLSDPVSFSL